MHSFRSVLDFDSGKVGTTNHKQLKVRRQHTYYAEDEFAELLKRQKFLNGNFKKRVHVIFG